MERNVVLVDSSDNQTGLMEIYKAHQNPGTLHRAISVLLFNDKGELLLQQRSKEKPLWPFFWSNTVCTHPFKGESYEDCAIRRLKEELGVSLELSALSLVYRFEYQADYNQDLSEHELDTVLVGKYNGEVKPVAKEVKDVSWVQVADVNQLIFQQDPGKAKESENQLEISTLKYETLNLNFSQLTPWFKLIMSSEEMKSYLSSLTS